MFAYVNGKFLPSDKAVISIKDRGFRYGDGIFETIAIYQGISYLWELHIKRLKAGLSSLNIQFNTEKLLNISRALIKKNRIDNGYLRIYITRGEASDGYLPLKSNPSLIIETTNGHKKQNNNANLCVAKYRKIPSQSLPVRNKLANSLNSVLVRIEANENNCIDGLMLDMKGSVCETSSANIFWFKKDILYTPSLKCDILAGTTRETIIKLSTFKVKMGKFSIRNLLDADEVFITNTSWLILPITKILPYRKIFRQAKRTKFLQQLLQENIKKYVAGKKNKMG